MLNSATKWRRPGHVGLLLVFTLTIGAIPSAGLTDEAPTQIPHQRLLTDDELVSLLDGGDNPDVVQIKQKYQASPANGLQALASYFREAYSRRYYFDWKNSIGRFEDYSELFPGKRSGHANQRDIHVSLYPARANWKLPFENLKGDPVTAYELRHLARQHKVLDMAFMHHYEDRNPVYVDYFTAQMHSLNRAFLAGDFEDDDGGNGVYESFRAGYRVMNWLQVHAFFLGMDRYDDGDQLELIRTMLHLGASLHARNPAFRYGNHQTRGLVALAMIAILFREYADTSTWLESAITLLGEHLDKEVNADGFQFERSIHYHIGDIYNYFRVLQLAQLNDIEVPPAWKAKLKAMFDAVVTLARPDRNLPVFQDDTNRPWAEYNEMGYFMLLGAVLFDDPVINYFASDSVDSEVYWLLREEQIKGLSRLERKLPVRLSAELPDTGYFVMRDGWGQADFYMAITAGLSDHKPDHQHGDMLGLVARAHRQEILPNYQVRYFLSDFEYFKNSLVKNVALVDNIPHGIGWRSNRGGSGFGKWEKLPTPRVTAWIKRDRWDFFAGSHDGYEELGVRYFRKVFFLKGLGWIVRDIFYSTTGVHEFQQVWQGHYSDEGSGNHHRATFPDGSGLEILQLGGQASSASTSIKRGKGNLVYTMPGETGAYTTLLYPYDKFDFRIPESFFNEGHMSSRGWDIQRRMGSVIDVDGFSTDANLVMRHSTGAILLGATWVASGQRRMEMLSPEDLHVEVRPAGEWQVTLLGHRPADISINKTSQKRMPGSVFELQ